MFQNKASFWVASEKRLQKSEIFFGQIFLPLLGFHFSTQIRWKEDAEHLARNFNITRTIFLLRICNFQGNSFKKN